MNTRFCDRTDAGQQLAQQLKVYANRADVSVLALPRGGVPVAYEISQSLNLPLDICLVRKLGQPGHEETAIGAIAADGVRVLNHLAIQSLRITPQQIERITDRELQELQRRERAYRGNRSPILLYDRIVILVDDGLATGATMRAAVTWLKAQQPRQLIVAVPIASIQAYRELKPNVDRLVCLSVPHNLYAIGLWYDRFDQVTDGQVRELLKRAAAVNHVTG